MKNKKTFAKIRQEVLDFYLEIGEIEALMDVYGVDKERADELFNPFMKGMLQGERMSDIPREMIKIAETMGEFLFLMNQAYKLCELEKEDPQALEADK
jgi:hypothetical protein